MSGAPAFDRREADRLLQRLLALPAGERRAALDAECDDAALHAAVLRLLRAAEAPSSPFDPGGDRSRRLLTGFAAQAAERQTPMAAGALVGPYRILEEIERGGMAVVYRAERVDGELTRQVAVKVLKLGLDTEEIVRRFEQERQILADLDHPNVARLYDAGRTEGGRPYFVMELVEGVPIDSYCDERRLPVDERLQLFLVVAGAVEYAHQNLVVHRDLKPSNILVDRAGKVKLLDFGIARLLDTEMDGATATMSTRASLRMMTPEYASPEQVRGERVTTASDVYQLGLLLYELLTGRRPYVVAHRSPVEIERTICEQPATRPSAAVFREDTLREGERLSRSPASTGGTAMEAICHARCTSPARLRRRLRGDLDNIVLKALHKEPKRRYSSADRLAQDIHKHRAGLPVSARAETWTYRGRKFLARHTLGTSTAATILVLATGLTAFHVVRIRSERDQVQIERTRAQAERDRAQAEATKARQMSQFLISLFGSADPRQARGEEITLREALDRAVERVDRELAGQPEVQGDMLQTLGRTYTELGVYDVAETLIRRAIELRREHLGPEHPEVARTLHDFGQLRYRQRRFGQTRELSIQALRILEASVGSDAPELAGILHGLGEAYRRLGEYEESQTALERALSIQAQATGDDSPAMAAILSALGSTLRETGAADRAEEHFERALAIAENQLGPDHPMTGIALGGLASTRAIQGKLEGTEAMYRRSLGIRQDAYGPVHLQVGLALNNLGNFLNMLGRPEEAVEVLERAVDVQSSALGPDNSELAFPLSSLGDAYMASGHLREARKVYRDSVTLLERAAGNRRFDPGVAHNLVQLGRLETRMGDSGAAELTLTRAAAMWKLAPGTVDLQFSPTIIYLGGWLAERQRCAEVVPLLRRLAPTPHVYPSLPRFQAVEWEKLLDRCSVGDGSPVTTSNAFGGSVPTSVENEHGVTSD